MRETVEMKLIERESQLAALRQSAHDAAAGQGRLVLIAGEAGVGKSILIERFQREMGGVAWSWGTCDGLSTPRPLAPLFDVALDLGGPILELFQAHPERDELFRALLQQLTASKDLNVVVVEDVHWADEATLDLLRFLARRIRTASVLLIVSYRDDSLTATSPLRTALGELGTLRWTRRLSLAPLSADAVTSLAADSDLDARTLFELTGGNPFYVCEMIEAGTHAVPWSARDAILARAARLSDEAADLLALASMTGTRIEERVLTAATRTSAVALDEVIASGLLVEDGPWLRFRHEIARLAVEQQIPEHRRAGIHAAILTALQLLESADDARLAFHAEGSGDEAAALHYSRRAAQRALELGAHREAKAQYERALRCATGADDATMAALYSGLAQEASLGDAWDIAADAYEKALTLWLAATDSRQQGETLRRYSIALKNLCRGDEGLTAARQAVEILQPFGPTAELAAAYATLAALRMMRSEHDLAIEFARRAQQLAKDLGAVEVIIDALNTEGCSLYLSDRRGMDSLRRALELALSHNLQAQAARAYHNLYSLLVDHHRFTESEQYYVDGIAYCDEHDLATYTYCLRAARVLALQELCRWDETLAMSYDLRDHSTASPLNMMSPHMRIGTIGARRGHHEIWPALDQALAAADGSGQPQCVAPVRLARAEAFWLEGRLDEARNEAELAADQGRGLDRWLRGSIATWLRRTSSERPVDGDIAEPFDLQLHGRHDEAARAWHERGCRYEAALALLDARNEPALREALDIFDDLGATATAKIARRELRRLGARSIPTGPRRATRSHPLGLTTREREVLELICARLTNAEIAQLLVISAKTVDHHVSSVLAKFDVHSREAAAAEARRRGLVSAQ